jgi:hypothetical protein
MSFGTDDDDKLMREMRGVADIPSRKAIVEVFGEQLRQARIDGQDAVAANIRGRLKDFQHRWSRK